MSLQVMVRLQYPAHGPENTADWRLLLCAMAATAACRQVVQGTW
jgi:hypothetical protein